MESREGKCYELAVKHIIEQQEGTLIHAEVYSFTLKRMIGHALVETETGFIYEPVVNRYFRKEDLYPKYKIKELTRYSIEEALLMVLREDNYGPWEDQRKEAICQRK